MIRGSAIGIAAAALLLAASFTTHARESGPGAAAPFDYYVLSLSWSPQYCASPAGRDDRVQCEGRRYGFVAHGLWPQHERGSPEFCGTTQPRQVKPQIVDEYLPIMPSPRLIDHQWKKHGTCSGLTQEQYFRATRQAFDGFRVPKAFEDGTMIRTRRDTVLARIRESNPHLPASAIALRCKGSDLAEVRVCLSRDLRPQTCGTDVRGSCPRDEIRVRPIR